jgi:hypothetical protein
MAASEPFSRTIAPRRFTLAVLCLVVAACTNQAAPDGSDSRLSEKLDCQAQARRQAELQYPRNTNVPAGVDAATQWYASDSRSDAEYRLYLSCLRSRGLISPAKSD